MNFPLNPSAGEPDLRALRQEVRARRRALGPAERQEAARRLAHRLGVMRVFATADRVATYLAFDGEIDPAALVERAWGMGKKVFLPILDTRAPLRFAPYRPDTPMKPNRFGIPEPLVDEDELLDPHLLDLVLTPLVAFDDRCTRVGMGGGFYDRGFAFRANPAHIARPRLVGVAYEMQRYPELPRRAWDIPLDGVVTETAIHHGTTGVQLE